MTAEIDSLLPELIEQLSAHDDVLVRASLAAIARMHAKAAPATNALKALLRHDEAEIRWAALQAFAAIGPAADDLLPELMACLEDPDFVVRLAATRAIRQVRPPSPIPPKKLSKYLQWLDRHVPELMREHHVPGVSIAVIQRGRLHWSRGFGVRDVRTQQAVTVDTVFEACSMSKPIMALAALQLIQNGQLDLDRPLTDYLGRNYLPDQPEHRRITPRMALTHRTGLPNWRMGYDEMGGPLPVLFPPGSDEGYSGEGMLLLQRAMEAVTHKSLEQLARERLFEPLDLRRTSYIWSERIGRDLASGHTRAGRFKCQTQYRTPNGAYSLYTTPTEYARLLQTLMEPSVLGEQAFTTASIDLLLQRHRRIHGAERIERPGLSGAVASYRALAWSVDVSPDGELVFHFGSNSSGFKTFGQFNRQKRSALILFTNADSGSYVRDAIIAKVGDL
jgi:CubicO group peptidase (beta-lactamase class C family)